MAVVKGDMSATFAVVSIAEEHWLSTDSEGRMQQTNRIGWSVTKPVNEFHQFMTW
jgi:hypothetical protein